MKRIVLFIILIFISKLMYCQIESDIEKEILYGEEPKSIIIYKAKELIRDNIIEEDLVKVKETKDYLINSFDTKYYNIFSEIEYYLLLYFTQEYEELGEKIIYDYENDFYIDFYNPRSFSLSSYGLYEVSRAQSNLLNTLLKKINEDSGKIESWIRDAQLEEDLESFLILFFHNIITKYQGGFSQVEQNYYAEEFLDKFPESRFALIVREKIRHKYVPSNWSFGGLFGIKYNILSDDLSQQYTDCAGFSISLFAYYKRLSLSLDAGISFSKTKREQEYSTGISNVGAGLDITTGGISLAYSIIQNKHIRISPNVGIHGLGFSYNIPSGTPKEIRELDLKSILTYSFGANFDIRLKTVEWYSNITHKYFIRIGYSYNLTRTEKKYPGITGDIHMINVCIVWEVRNWVREY